MSKKKTTPSLDVLLKRLATRERRQQRALNSLTKRIKSLPTVPRAEAWLRYVAEKRSRWGDEEALTHLVEAGHDLKAAIDALREEWKQAERAAISQARLGGGHKGPGPSNATLRIRDYSNWQLPNFWVGHDHQAFHIDAAMLRAVDTCDIGGFEDWWERLIEEETENVITGYWDAIPSSYWLFSMVRSSIARERMKLALERTLARISSNFDRNEAGPWRVMSQGPTPEHSVFTSHLGFAANLAFAAGQLSRAPVGVALAAAQELVKTQRPDGSWPVIDCISVSSVGTTARAVLGLAAARPRGHAGAIASALKWLQSQQSETGYWVDGGEPDTVFLTVIVLDAMKHAAGSAQVVRAGALEQMGDEGMLLQRRLQELFQAFTLLAQSDDHQARGYDLEDLLRELFLVHKIRYRKPYTADGEQIDGSFTFGGFHYIVEARWRKAAPDLGELAAIRTKVQRKIESTRGFVVSIAPFSEDVLRRLREAGPANLVFMDGYDLTLILEGRVSLVDALQAKVDKAAQEGIMFFSLAGLFRE